MTGPACRSNRGFTLIELMIVVAILAAIAIPSYQQYSARARWSDNLTSIADLKQAVGHCLSNNNSDKSLCDSVQKLIDTGFVRADYAPPMPPYGAEAVSLEAGTAAIVVKGNVQAGSCTVRMVPDTSSPAVLNWTPVNSTGCNRSVTGVGS